MRTTFRLDDELLAEVKALAARTHRSMNSVVEDALRELLARQRRRSRQEVSLTTFGGNGLQPGVDLDDTAALYDLMDEADEAS
ncbi:CopG family ribbon-helix-helix protein [Phytoactinopolyspora mesophila]|uniref:Ribbon-helix-helix protein, CopG family n=1 Tax=Phytoactinopolyspora mesophila TaxID=2650750 RepID=A0A7K3MBA1_9ACTN|nr:ribbon-helix-helix protein, CopG family [Phytoactinopolyspora mesophila]NDL60536.1 ribbon-helix-helix protein, CopG family [Phytoactinopolyspora mesophila]